MKLTALTAVLAAAPLAAASGDYSDYLARFPRTFANSEEREARETLFAARVAEIEAHNADSSQSYTKGINQFTDMFDEEIRSETLGYVPTKTTRAQAAPHRHLEASSLADKVDWREVPGVLTAIKDQGHCGSCWTFAGTAAIESAVAINTGKLYALSEQQSVSCIANPDSCGGTGMPIDSRALLAISGKFFCARLCNFIPSIILPFSLTLPPRKACIGSSFLVARSKKSSSSIVISRSGLLCSPSVYPTSLGPTTA